MGVNSFYEFFAGGGMARAGFGARWSCLFANDIDPGKASVYSRNWGGSELRVEDISALKTVALPGYADLAWASFPCQDLSLAGSGAGLQGNRSGTFWPFWNLILGLATEGRAPPIVVLENVCGTLTSHEGRDFAVIGDAIAKAGYRFGALVIDAVRFVPQSRPRLFIVAVSERRAIPGSSVSLAPNAEWHPPALVRAYERLSGNARRNWLWWRLASPPARNAGLSDLIEEHPEGVRWHTTAETQKLINMMTPVNLEKVVAARRTARRMIGTIYKRTRRDENGVRTQRAEVRFDNIAGCLRTPTGGSSRQTVMAVEPDAVRSRLLSPREAARLMGLPDDYKLPENYNQAYHLAGDGVVVPVVRHLAEHILEPVLGAHKMAQSEAA